MDSLEEMSPVCSLSFLPEEVPSIFQEFQDIIQMDCSGEINGRFHNNQYSNNEMVDESSKRTRIAPLRDNECSPCPVSSTLKTIKPREDKPSDHTTYVRSGKPSIVRPYSHNNMYRKKYGGIHQHKNCANGSMVNECDFESRAPYFPHCDERLTTDTYCRVHQHNTISNCTRYNNIKNKRCMKTVRCSENAKGSSLAQLLCDTEPSQVHSLGSSNNSTINLSSYSPIKRIPKNNYVDPNKVLQIFGEDDCSHPTEEHVDCYDCNSAAMLCLIDTAPQDSHKSNRVPVSMQNSLPPSPERTKHHLYPDNDISKHNHSLDGYRTIPKHIPPAVSSRISIHNKSCCENGNSKNNSSLRLLLDQDDSANNTNSSALRALLVADSKNNNKNGSSLRLLPAPNAPTMQQLLMSKEPIRVRGCSGAVVNPSVLHNLLVTGRDVIAGYSITSSTAKTDEFIISRNSSNGNYQNDMFIREMEDDDKSSQYFHSSDFSQRNQSSEESLKNIKFGGQVTPDVPMNSKELTGPYSVCSQYDKKKSVTSSQNCRPTRVECHSSTNTTSPSRTRSDHDTRESFILDSNCETFDNTNQRTATNQRCNSSTQEISTKENNEPDFPEENMDHHSDNQDPLLDSGMCAADLNLYRNTNEEDKVDEDEEDPAVGISIYRNIQDDPDFSLPSLYDLTQQTDYEGHHYELNTPPSSSHLLQCSDLFMTLEHAF